MEFKMIPCPAHDLELTWEKDELLIFCDDLKSIILIGYRLVLTPYEYKILKLLSDEPDGVMADDIIQTCFKHKDVTHGNVAVHVHNINQKAFPIMNRRLIGSARGQGYKITDNI